MPKMTPVEVDELLATLRSRMIEAGNVDIECWGWPVERVEPTVVGGCMDWLTSGDPGGYRYSIRINGGV
jgi:hypothetical protein